MVLCLLFGANAVAIKIGLTGLGVFTAAGLRFGAGAILIVIWAKLTGSPLAVNKRQFCHLCLLAVIFYVQLSLFYFGLSRTTASHGTLITNVLPFIVMILAHHFIPGDSFNLKKLSGLILGFSGVVVLFFDGTHFTNNKQLGDLLVLLAVLLWGCHVIYIKKIIEDFGPIQITLYPLGMAAPLFLISGFIWDGEMVRFVDGPIIKAMLYQTFITASFGLVAWNSLIQKYGATALHSFIFIMPLSGVFFGILLLGEPVTTGLVCSILLVVSGLIVVNSVGNTK